MTGKGAFSGSTANRDMNLPLARVRYSADGMEVYPRQPYGERRPKEAATWDRQISNDEITQLCYVVGLKTSH